MPSLGLRKETGLTYDQALERLPAALKAQGFGVLTRVDVHTTLAEKLSVAVRRTTILGACHPPSAYTAITADPEAALMMPCNVVVHEDDAQRAVVTAVDPARTVAASGRPALVALAADLRVRLDAVLAQLPGAS